MKIALVGKGRVATHLSTALAGAGHEVCNVGGRVRRCPVPDDVEVVILSVNDDAIAQVAAEFSSTNALVLHTSGSTPISAIPTSRRGVLYPMQTFSMDRTVDFDKVPLFLEASSDSDMCVLSNLAHSISSVCIPLDGEGRRVLHLAAVFCCNFVNHLLEITSDLLAQRSLPLETMFPLIEETIAKVHQLPAHEAQTGPAIRGDKAVMERHMQMLSDPLRREMYQIISRSIEKTHQCDVSKV